MIVTSKLNTDIYKCISDDIISTEVIITEEQEKHIKLKHEEAFHQAYPYLENILNDPDYILKDSHKNTGIVIKKIDLFSKSVLLVLKVVTSQDNQDYKNSIISCWAISDKRLKNYLRNKTILYKKND